MTKAKREPPDESDGPPTRKLSRSALLAGSGAAAAGLSLGRAGPVPAGLAGQDLQGQLGVPADSQNALELVLKIDQVGGRFTTYGYLTHVAGLPTPALFTARNRQNEGTARFIVHSVTEMQSRSILKGVHALNVVGPMGVYLRAKGGASFDYPDSFKQGELVASYAGTFQSIVNVTAPRKGIETLTGGLRQTAAERFSLRGASRVLGRKGLRMRVEATGAGTLLEPTRPRAELVVAGYAVVVR